ncbi:MAG: HAMP domain-containing protein, partial [Planctomycetota bacterium]
MSLQNRLFALLSAFAAFALLATFATIYAVRLQSVGALASLQRNQAESEWIERLRLSAREQDVRLGEVVAGIRAPDALYLAERDAFLDQLRQVAQFTLGRAEGATAEELLNLTAQLRAALDQALADVRADQAERARRFVQERVEGQLLPAVDLRLQNVHALLNEARVGAVDELVATNTQVLTLALIIAALGVALVAVGTALLRRWVFRPLRRLEAAAREFGAGNFAHRAPDRSGDELGALGSALNRMAAAVADAQESLRGSEAKYRALFSNLHDATLICDAQGRILEAQDGESRLLARLARDCAGQSLLELWRRTQADTPDWPTILGRVLTAGGRVRISDVRLPFAGAPEQATTVDLLIFPIALGPQRALAVILRDVSEQRRAELQFRRSEAMGATVTLARGVAHDFGGLLTSAIGSLSVLTSELGEGHPRELVRRALRACGQAVSLARTLLTFAGGNRGNPEILRLAETIELILNSLDEDLLAHVRLCSELDREVTCSIDRDQFTEIVLNLIRNACEA